MSVKVAVRVRPFNQREIQLGKDKCIVEMKGNQTILNKGDGSSPRDFAFDYSFWSHNGYVEKEDGYMIKDGQNSKYCDQEHVFKSVGEEVLDNAWKGYHCCLFAYGQTGSGKSYSMVGYGANKGIVPISCDQIFKRINANTNKNITYEVDVSMLEIYNEKIQDLMIETVKRPKEGLKVREHKLYGVYVENLSKYQVNSYQEIDQRMEQGTRNRTVGATQMNQNSSRAHTIIKIEFKTIEVIEGKQTQRLSVINLVDLAGSEKLSKTEATGDRFKEGININQSLSSLGLVIWALAEKAMGKSNKVVPYRDSQLTRILQNALGGNSKTLMICAISPSDDNYEETLSTLRYADQAKKIKCNAVINESEQDKMIRQLKEENDQLKKMLEAMMKGGQINMQQLGNIKDEMEQNEQFMEFQNQKSITNSNMKVEENHDSQIEYITNINEDPLLNNKITYYLDKQVITIGRRQAEPKNDIELIGLGIHNNHCKIVNSKEGVFIQELDSLAKEYIMINGNKLQSVTKLNHNDRIVLGTNLYFIYRAKGQQLDSKYDWEYLQAEILSNTNGFKEMHIDQEINQYKLKLEQEQMKRQQEINDLKEEYENRIKLLQSKEQQQCDKKELEEIQEEAEEIQHEINFMMLKDEEQIKEKQIMPQLQKEMEMKLSKYYKWGQEMNVIAKTFNKDVQLSSKIIYEFDDDEDNNQEKQLPLYDCHLKIEVINNDYGYIYRWDLEKFEIRYQMLQNIMQEYLQTNIIPKLEKEQDPFWDPPEPILIGQSYVQLLNIPYIIENPCMLEIIAENKEGGQLEVNTIPTDVQGQINLAEYYDQNDKLIEMPEEMLGLSLYFNLNISQISFSSPYFISDMYCQYQFLNQNAQMVTFKTPTFTVNGTSTKLNYTKLHGFEKVTQEILDFLVEKQICLQIYGVEKVNQQVEDQKIRVDSTISINKQKRQSILKTQLSGMNQEAVKRRSTQLMLTPLQFNELKKIENMKDNKQKNKQKKKDGCIIF